MEVAMVESVAELRTKAQAKRGMAQMVRRVVAGLSVARHREMIRQHVEDLEAEAAALEAQAAALERLRSG